jgi:hypothetical protein
MALAVVRVMRTLTNAAMSGLILSAWILPTVMFALKVGL